jgi:ankyrin repeat protein
MNVADPTTGLTPLMAAIFKENKSEVRRLVDTGADVNRAGRAFTPLTCAVVQHGISRNMLDIIQYLLEKGADINGKSPEEGNTPLITAIGTIMNSWGPGRAERIAVGIELLTLLINAGADVNIKNSYDESALHKAIRVRSPEVADFLIKHGADVNLDIDTMNNLIFTACMNGRADILQLLLAAGADLNRAQEQNIPPLVIAVYKNFVDVIGILMKAGANINLPAKENIRSYILKGLSPLLVAIITKNSTLVKLLMESNAALDFQISDEDYCNAYTSVNKYCPQPKSPAVHSILERAKAGQFPREINTLILDIVRRRAQERRGISELVVSKGLPEGFGRVIGKYVGGRRRTKQRKLKRRKTRRAHN